VSIEMKGGVMVWAKCEELQGLVVPVFVRCPSYARTHS
jgi:hypothetical protein